MIIRLLRMSPAFFFFSVMLLAAGAKAQTPGTISGTVTDSIGNAVPGATVTNKQTKVAISTDAYGKFHIAATEGQELEIKSVGYATGVIIVGSDKIITPVLLNAPNALNDVVVVGYGTQLKRQVTGSLASVDVADAKKFSTSDINGMLQGRVTGVQVRKRWPAGCCA